MTLHTLVSRLGPCLFVMCALTAHAQPSSPPPKPAPLKTLQDDLPANAVRTASLDKVRVLLVADFETTLSSPTTARIARLNVSMGLPFQSGQVLIAFDCEEPLARLKMAKAEMVAAQETLDARVRMQGLDQASAVEVALAAAAVNKAHGQIDLNDAQIGQCAIKAPWSGRIAKVHIKSFMSVTPGQPLLDLVKSGPLRLKLNVPSKLIAQISKTTVFAVDIDETGKTYEAKVNAVNSRVDPVSQTVEVEAVLVKPYPDLLPGMSGVASLSTMR